MSKESGIQKLTEEACEITDTSLVLSLKVAWLTLEKAAHFGDRLEAEFQRLIISIYETELFKRLRSRHPILVPPTAH